MRLQALKADHEYQFCRDEDCERFPCRIYKEGHGAGHAAGFGEGYGDGYAEGFGEGYGEGFAAGAASASG